jgi:hypothetical protein
MGWEFTTVQRIRTAASLIVVFLLILATNMVDSHHFTIVQNSLTSVYEDRLLAKNYIYKISRQMQVKRNLLESRELAGAIEINKQANDSIRVLIDKYRTTKLTEMESRRFATLQDKISRLFQYEQRFSEGEVINEELPTLNDAERYYSGVYEDLDALSQIQVDEGKRELLFSNQTIDSSNLIAKIEIGVLILIGLVLQLLIFLKPIK